MTYDSYGNILTKNGVAYTYDSIWKDLLTSYNGQSITYDAQGNPTSYIGHALTWEKGRQLKSFNGTAYTYNANGIRTSKTVDGVCHDYLLDGSRIIRETWGDNTLIPLCDNEDSVCGIIYNDEPYYFLKNLQGDIIAITDKDANVVARYTYDAWGKCTIAQDTTSVGIATVNPFRYRGYYYDNEIGMYYLQSRYYDPNTGRFINADDTVVISNTNGILGNNLYTYCENKPVNETDNGGNIALTIIKKIVVGILKGLFKQLCIDVIEWLYKKFVKNSKAKFKPSSPADYVSTVVSLILKEFSLSNIVGAAFSIVCLLIKYIPKLVFKRMKKTDWLNLLIDVMSVVLTALLKNEFKKLQNKRREVTKKMMEQTNLNTLLYEKKQITFKIDRMGWAIQVYIPLSQKLLKYIIEKLC